MKITIFKESQNEEITEFLKKKTVFTVSATKLDKPFAFYGASEKTQIVRIVDVFDKDSLIKKFKNCGYIHVNRKNAEPIAITPELVFEVIDNS
ncbi:MAG: hypothetical protein EP346_00255, partial [Bacteroidetes bacterium]